jgi:hypothetical protein
LVEYSLRSVDLCFEIGTSSSESDICKAVLMEMQQGCFNGNALDWDQQFWSIVRYTGSVICEEFHRKTNTMGPGLRKPVRYMRVSVLCEADIGEFYCMSLFRYIRRVCQYSNAVGRCS